MSVKNTIGLLCLVLAVAACGPSDGGLMVNDARVGVPTGPNAAVYFTIENNEDHADALLEASAEVAGAVEIHETVMGDDGTMGMRPVDAPLEAPAGGTLVLEPGGYHLMLVGVDRLEVGESVEITLVWEEAGEMTVAAEVVEPQDAVEHEGHDG